MGENGEVMPNYRAPWRDLLSVERLKAMNPSEPISPETVLLLASEEAELADKYVQKCEELRDAESINEQLRETSMKPSAVQVAIDILRESGHEDVARWVEHPEAVRTLLKDPPADRNGECPGPAEYETISGRHMGSCGGSEYHHHARTCPIVAAWRAIGDSRAADDIENAHDEALQEARHRSAATTMTLYLNRNVP